MKCDHGILVPDRSFGGSDTWARPYVLSASIPSLAGIDLIFCGERATDGDTAQIGPGIAGWLDIPVATYVARIEVELLRGGRDGDSSTATSAVANRSAAAGPPPHIPAPAVVERLVEEGYQRVRVRLLALLAVVKEIASPRLPTFAGKKRARIAEVPVLSSVVRPARKWSEELGPAGRGPRSGRQRSIPSRASTPCAA